MSIVELLAELTKRDVNLDDKDRILVEQSAQLDELSAKTVGLEKKLERAAHEREEYRKLYELATLELERLRRHIFGKKSEKVPEEQLALALGAVNALIGAAGIAEHAGQDTQDDQTEEDANAGGEKKKRKPTGKQPLPAHLPVEEITLLPLELRGEDRDEYECIGEEVCETLEHRSASQVRVRIVRPKFVRKGCAEAGVMTAAPPELPIARGLAGPALLAQVVIDKFEDHQGLHRQERRFARDGIHLADSTMGGWMKSLHTLCDPLVLAMCVDSKKTCPFIATDATGVLVLDKEECRRGHFFVLLGGDKHVLFRYSDEHTTAAIKKFLGDYKGYVVADAHSIYDALYRDGKCIEAACWAHARRYFYKALGSDPERARLALALIAKLFKVERELEGETRTKKERIRAAKSKPVLNSFFAWCLDEKGKVLDGTPVAMALGYALNQRAALERFVADGRLPIHNNDSERALRQLVIGRRNWLFVGSDEGGHRAATFVSLIASAKLHGLEPYAYLRDLFCLLPSWPRNRVLELAPAYFNETLKREDVQERLRDNICRAISLGQQVPSIIYAARS